MKAEDECHLAASAQESVAPRQSAWRWRHLLVLAAYILLTIGMTWPIANHLGSHIPGGEGDAWNHLWTFNWVKRSLLAGRSPFYADLLFYPAGATLVYHNIAWLHFFFWLPLQWFLGLGAAYSLVFLANFVFNGFATYLLVTDLTGRWQPAVVAGLIAAFWPYILSHHAHPNLVTIGWLPLILLALRRLFELPGWRYALAVGLLVALAALTRWQLILMMSPVLALYVLYRFLVNRSLRNWHVVGLLALAGVVAVVLMAPLAAPVVWSQLARSNPGDLLVDEVANTTDLLAYVVPNRYQPWWGEVAYQKWYQNFEFNKVLTPFVGYTTLLLVVIGTIGRWLKARFWLLCALLLIILALGSSPQVNGQTYFSLPDAFLYDFFALKLIRHPDRLNVVLSIPVAILAGLGVATLLERLPWRLLAQGLVVLLAGLILLEYASQYPLLPLEVPSWYQAPAQDAGQYAILDVPMDDRSYDKNYMLYQITHGKPIVGGHISRVPPEAFTFIEAVPLLQDLRDGRLFPPELPDLSRQLDLLADAGVRYLVLHKKYLAAEHEGRWRDWFPWAADYESDDLIVFATEPPLVGRDLPFTHGLLPAGRPRPKLGIVQSTVAPTQTTPGGVILLQLHWGATEGLERDYRVCVGLEGEQDPAAEACQPLAPSWPTSQWQANELALTRHALTVDPFAAAGSYAVTVNLLDGAGTPVGSAVVGNVTVDALARQFELPRTPSVAVDETWAEKFQLLGYDLAERADSLQLTLYWRALQRSDQSYKLFVHLRDVATGSLLAQADVVPRDWTYPTNWWERGEVVVDTISVPLDGVRPGSAQLVLGWYEPETGARLRLTSAPAGSDQVPLTTIQIVR